MMYDLAFTFWSSLSTEQAKLSSAKALAHKDVPYYLSNAAWYPKPGDLNSVTEWYAARDLPPALIVPALRAEGLERSLQDNSFQFEKQFQFRPAVSSPDTPDTIVEQVSWSQSRNAAKLLADFYEQPALDFAIAKSLTAALQAESSFELFLAYDETPVGAMLTFESKAYLSAVLLVDNESSLETRLVQEADSRGLTPFILEPLPDDTTPNAKRSLERWSIS